MSSILHIPGKFAVGYIKILLKNGKSVFSGRPYGYVHEKVILDIILCEIYYLWVLNFLCVLNLKLGWLKYNAS